jgi:hypothetical protein
MPEANLFTTLNKHTRGRTILADESDDTELRQRCTDTAFVMSVRFGGELIKDQAAPANTEPLYIELTVSS